jgi:hypothetical protein
MNYFCLEKYLYNAGYAYQTSLATLKIQASHIRPSVQSVWMNSAYKSAAVRWSSANFIGLFENNIIFILKWFAALVSLICIKSKLKTSIQRVPDDPIAKFFFKFRGNSLYGQAFYLLIRAESNEIPFQVFPINPYIHTPFMRSRCIILDVVICTSKRLREIISDWH